MKYIWVMEPNAYHDGVVNVYYYQSKDCQKENRVNDMSVVKNLEEAYHWMLEVEGY